MSDEELKVQDTIVNGLIEHYKAVIEQYKAEIEHLKGVAIPSAYKGMTNGEVLKVMFPNIFTFNCRRVENVGYFNFSEDDWWNSPYKGEHSRHTFL